MYLSDIVDAWDYDLLGLQQKFIDEEWLKHYPPPAPILPASMKGMFLFGTKGGNRLTPKRGSGSKSRPFTNDERAFWNYYSKHMDPFRKQSTLSKIAGGVLTVASVALPVMSTFKAVSDAGNAGLQIASAKQDVKELEAYAEKDLKVQEAEEAAKSAQQLQAQLATIRSFAAGPAVNPAPTFQLQAASSSPVPTKTSLSNSAIIGIALGGYALVILLLGEK